MIGYEGGGNTPAVVVPLVALGTEAGTIDVVDVSANAVAASFSAHTSRIRGLNWLGNSRLVSFSCSRVKENIYSIKVTPSSLFDFFNKDNVCFCGVR